MATIDIKLKSYEQLQFEIIKLNTDILLKDREIERLKEVIQKNDKEIDNLCKNQKKEIERLNKECDTYMKIATKRGNIIDELEKYIKDTKKYSNMIYMDMEFIKVNDILNKLKELKEGK